MSRLIVRIILLLSYVSIQLNAQDIAKQSFKVGNKKYDYYETKSSSPIKGLLILLPAAGEVPKSILTKVKLHEVMTRIGYVTIAPEIPTEMFANKECIAELDELTKIKLAQYNLLYGNIILGGLSDGGSIALGYTEYLNSRAAQIKVKAVFAIDPPADLSRIYSSAQIEANYNCSAIKQEGKNVKAYLDKVLGGAPDANPENYYQNSIFLATKNDGGNARFLKDIKVRLYCEPDLAFVKKTYCSELQFFNLNAYDLQRLISFLKNGGNEHAQYVTTNGKGFHSWNIVDPDDFARWVTNL